MAKKKKRAKRNPRRRGESKICHKAKRLVKRKKTRRQGRALFAEASHKGKPCRHLRVRPIKARKNPARASGFVIVGVNRRRSGGRMVMDSRWFWTGSSFDSDRKRAKTFESERNATIEAKKILPRVRGGLYALKVLKK